MNWPGEMREISCASSVDGTRQFSLFYAPATKEPRPLVLSLHPWSGDYRDELDAPLAWVCIKQGWCFAHPDFRGPSNRPEAVGSSLVLQDIVDAVRLARSMAAIDAAKIAVVGLSGGGYTALMAAARMPRSWVGVSAWVPIVDLAAWYQETMGKHPRYAQDISEACGGAPGSSKEADEQYRNRSPLTCLARAKQLRMDINAGIHDGHGEGSVPVRHSLRAFNALARPRDRLRPAEIAFITEKAQVPQELDEAWQDAAYEGRRICFRRESRLARVTLFEGGHEMILGAAATWLEAIFSPFIYK